MNIDEIHDMWAEDTKIDQNQLASEAVRVPLLHSKYQRLYSDTRLRLRKLEADYTILKKDKLEFYMDGPNEETIAKGWKMPPKGRILRAEASMYVDADPDIINMSLRIGLVREKVELLESIVKSVNNRGYLLKTALDFNRFIAGG